MSTPFQTALEAGDLAAIRACPKADLRLKAHVGEWGTGHVVGRAVEVLELDEIQHGIAAVESPQVMRLNLCSTSNLKLGRVGRSEDYPIRRL